MVAHWIIPPVAGLIEPAVAPEFFASKVGAVERVGSMLRFYLVAEQMPLDGGAVIAQNVVIAKVLQPIDSLPISFELLAKCLMASGTIEHDPPPAPNGGRPRPQLVR